jgi:hypothetical protein
MKFHRKSTEKPQKRVFVISYRLKWYVDEDDLWAVLKIAGLVSGLTALEWFARGGWLP